MSKPRHSKLDPFADGLAERDAQNVTLADMQAWLAENGCDVSLGRLSEFLSAQRQARMEATLLGRITNGSRLHSEVKAQFGENPAPELDTLIQLHRVLIMQLSAQAATSPELIQQASAAMRTVMEYTAGQTRAALESRKLELQERRVVLLEQKAAAFDQVKAAVNSGGITPETLSKIERELKLL